MRKLLKIFLTSKNLLKEILLHNNNPIAIKDLRKEIMERSKLKNSLNKNRHYANCCKCKTQRNYCLSLVRKTISKYFKKLNMESLTNDQIFWKKVQPTFSNKSSSSGKNTFVGNIKVLIEEKEIDRIMNNSLQPYKSSDLKDINLISSDFSDPVRVEKYDNIFQLLSTMVSIFLQSPLKISKKKY